MAGSKTYHTFAWGKCTRCGRNQSRCDREMGCDGHAWERHAAVYGSNGNTIQPEMLWCPNCFKEQPLDFSRRFNYGGKCEPPEATPVGMKVNGPKNPPMKEGVLVHA